MIAAAASTPIDGNRIVSDLSYFVTLIATAAVCSTALVSRPLTSTSCPPTAVAAGMSMVAEKYPFVFTAALEPTVMLVVSSSSDTDDFASHPPPVTVSRFPAATDRGATWTGGIPCGGEVAGKVVDALGGTAAGRDAHPTVSMIEQAMMSDERNRASARHTTESAAVLGSSRRLVACVVVHGAGTLDMSTDRQ